MSHPNFATWVPLPAPVTTGTTVQSYTDPQADLWVAKNGVKSGAWRRPTDAIHSRGTLSANVAGTTSYSIILWNVVTYDNYGCYSATTGRFTCPIAGFYRVYSSCCTTGTTAVGQYANMALYQNATAVAYGGYQEAAGSGDNPGIALDVIWYCNANDTLGIYWMASVTNIAINSGQYSYGEFHYVGTS